jgi:hypothetical protein
VATRAALFHTNNGGDVFFEEKAGEDVSFQITDSRTREHLPRASKNVFRDIYIDRSPSPTSETEKYLTCPIKEREEQRGVGGIEIVKDNDAMPADNEWSPIHFGSDASAQCLFWFTDS